MRGPVIILVVNSEKHCLVFAATRAFTTIGRQNFSSERRSLLPHARENDFLVFVVLGKLNDTRTFVTKTREAKTTIACAKMLF